MKKFLALAITVALAVSFTACSSANTDDVIEETSTSQVETTASSEPVTMKENVEESDVAMETEAEYVVFNASLDFQIESDAWLGVIPTGTIYENEVDADDYDILYTYCENFDMDGVVSHRFAFNKEQFYEIEDGTYDLVLCSSDNAEIGKVLLQIGFEKNGENIVLDYENSK